MSSPGESDPTDLLIRARSALIDAIEALDGQHEAVIVIGALAVYLRAGGLDVALDPRVLADEPRIETAMRTAGFLPSASGQPGSWVTPAGIPVDLMVPEALAGPGGPTARAARLPPHDRKALRRARGLEAALVDNDEMEVRALDPADGRAVAVRIAGPAALLVAKTHKIAERVATPHRLNDKDAHDAYRLLRAFDTALLTDTFLRLLRDDLTSDVTRESVDHLEELFGSPNTLGSEMAGRAEEGVGDPEQVAVAVSILASDLVTSLRAG
ncbi:hypothetical protein [Cellulomonas hominis]